MRAAATMILLLALPARGQEEHLGPAPTRDQYPINFQTLSYIPAPPDVLASGRYEADLQTVEANTLDFSNAVQLLLVTPPPPQRLSITPAQAQEWGARYPTIPLLYYFQMETNLATLRLRTGLGHGWEASVMVSFFSAAGGFEDGLIENVHHSFGFNDVGRTSVQRDQVRVVVIQNGQLTYYSDRGVRPTMLDPLLGLTQNLYDSERFAMAVNLQLKPPVTRDLYYASNGWDSALQFTGRWSPNASVDTYFGVGAVHRQSGSLLFNRDGFRDQLGVHAMIEGWRDGSWRPFLQLVYLTGTAYPVSGTQWNQPSLQQDLGLHWLCAPNLVFTFRYLKDITTNNNTMEMALIMEAAWRFGTARR